MKHDSRFTIQEESGCVIPMKIGIQDHQRCIHDNKTKNGFTLIEIIVSLAIFAVVAVIAVGALIRVTSANRQAQSIQTGVNNMSFVLDAISREMRVGTGYKCFTGGNLSSGASVACPSNTPVGSNYQGGSSPDTLLTFSSTNTTLDTGGNTCNLTYGYLFHVSLASGTTTIYKAEETSCNQGLYVAGFYPVTNQTVNLTGYSLGLFNDTTHPYSWVFLRIQGYVGAKVKEQSVFDVETAISERTQG